jgi:hypothetical protein
MDKCMGHKAILVILCGQGRLVELNDSSRIVFMNSSYLSLIVFSAYQTLNL